MASKLEEKIWLQLRESGLATGCVREVVFCPGRKWRADFLWASPKLILEVQGGIWTKGRHARPHGIVADYEKWSEAAILGYRIILVTGLEISNNVALDRVRRALKI